MTGRRHPRHRQLRPRSRRKTVLIATFCALSVLSVPVIAQTMGASALFSASTSGHSNAQTGVLTLALQDTGTGSLSVPVSQLQPGQTVERTVNLANTGTLALGVIQLQFLQSADVTAAALANVSDGLQLAIDRCSTEWTASGSRFTCAGDVTVVTADRPATAVVDLAASPALAVAAIDHLRITLRLPTSSPMSAQGASGSLTLRAVGQQAASSQK